MYVTSHLTDRPETDAVASSRRSFLKLSGAGALVIGVTLGASGAFAEEAAGGGKALAATGASPPMPNAFVHVSPDNTVTVVIKHLDKGQGVTTGLATIVAEELDADWAQMRTEFAPANALLYNNTLLGPIQGTGGSTSVANSWTQLRRAGAAARAMLVSAAAESWKVPAAHSQSCWNWTPGITSRCFGEPTTMIFPPMSAQKSTRSQK